MIIDFSADTVLQLREGLTDAKEQYLHGHGWSHSSSHPGAYWMWTKRIGKRTYHVQTDLALTLEETLEREP